MYKLLLCWRYLLTRYLALACIVSVMLGVATLIVVNAVMSGFSTKLKERLHSLLSDVMIESYGLEGFGDYEKKMQQIREDPFLREHIVAMAPTMEVFAMLQFTTWDGRKYTRPIHLVGVDPKTRSQIGGFKEHLEAYKNVEPSFEPAPAHRRQFEERERLLIKQHELDQSPATPGEPPPPTDFPPIKPKLPQGAIVGRLIATYPYHDPITKKLEEGVNLFPGDDVMITTVGGQKLAPVYDRFIVVDYFKSEMSEYDSQYVFVSLDYLQHLRTMENRVTSIQIKLKEYASLKDVKDRLQEMFREDRLPVYTWEDKQGALLAAIAIEKGILNVLLFLIVAVAGFGILAIFSMIVSEKTRDIGILKALGASNGGVMKIFLGYGLLLGVVGAVLGSSVGLSLAIHINDVEQFLTKLTGQEVFNRQTYYFKEIPTDIQPMMVLLVNFGAIAIAVMFSILPALRAALLHPVRALRYE